MCISILSLDYNPALFFIAVKSGLVGVLTVLSFAQLMPELLAAQYPLRFLDLYGMKYKAVFKLELSNINITPFFSFLFSNRLGSYSVLYVSLVFDYIGVGHAAWFIHYTYDRVCGGEKEPEG